MSPTHPHDELATPVGTTLERYIMRKQAEFPFATGELSQLLRDIALAAKIVNREINRSGLIDVAGAYGQQNVQGEEQQKLDDLVNAFEAFKEAERKASDQRDFENFLRTREGGTQ